VCGEQGGFVLAQIEPEGPLLGRPLLDPSKIDALPAGRPAWIERFVRARAAKTWS